MLQSTLMLVNINATVNNDATVKTDATVNTIAAVNNNATILCESSIIMVYLKKRRYILTLKDLSNTFVINAGHQGYYQPYKQIPWVCGITR